jgi:beta-alanine degradation protein BauB
VVDTQVHPTQGDVEVNTLACVLTLAPLILLAGSAKCQKSAPIDAVTASPDRFTVLLNNDQVRVVQYTLRPGERDQWHTHPPKVSYVVSGGELRIHMADGTSFPASEKAGTASWMDALPRHYAENVGTTTVTIVLTEVKSATRRTGGVSPTAAAPPGTITPRRSARFSAGVSHPRTGFPATP